MLLLSISNFLLLKSYSFIYVLIFLQYISRDEITSLSVQKKGWQKSTIGDQSSNALILLNEIKKMNVSATSGVGNASLEKPKTSMELERDLRRLATASLQGR